MAAASLRTEDSEVDLDQPQLPEHLRVQRDYVIAGEHLNYHVCAGDR